MTYRATPITQRDGSALANSNCRMASIATGLDYHTLGAKRSTGKAMRAAQDDQSGGTDSGDARAAWSSGYGESLRVMDGSTFDDARADLLAGRLVHLDVYAATLGGVCLSGSGAYGHTIAVAPERHSDGQRWLVADPWCSPPSWSWTSEAALRAAADEWGRQVYGRAVQEADWPTGGDRHHPLARAILARVARRLMTEAYPEGPTMTLEPFPPETGGGAILYTTTRSQGEEASDMARFIQANGYGVGTGIRLDVAEGTDWFYLDGTKGGDISKASTLTVVGMIDAHPGEWAVLIGTGKPYADGEARTTVGYVTGGTTYPAPEAPTGGDGDDTAARQAQWDADAAALIGPRPE